MGGAKSGVCVARKLNKTTFPGVFCQIDEKTNVKTYIARIKIAGIIDTEQVVGYSNDAINTNPTLAFLKRQELISKIKNGESIKVKEDPTFDNAFSDYLDKRKSGKTLTENKIEIYRLFYNKHFPDSFKRKKIKQITKDDLQNIIDIMVTSGKYKPSYIVTIKAMLSPLFKELSEKELITKNFISNLKFPKYDKNKYFDLEQDKAKALYKAILNIPDNQYRAMFLFLLRGRRSGEVLTLDWENINFDKRIYIITDQNSKIRKNLTFPLDDELIEALNCLTVKKSGYVFVSKKTGTRFKSFPRRLFDSIKEELGIDNMSFHSFRHLLGMTLVNNGVALEYISKALGHSRIATTQMYSNQKETMAKVAVDSYLDLMR